MCSVKEKRELAVLMRISREFDIIGDVTVTVDNPSELLAWSMALKDPTVVAWRAEDSAKRFVQVSAKRTREPIRGRITAVLPCLDDDPFWACLDLDDMEPGQQRDLTATALSAAWADTPFPPQRGFQPTCLPQSAQTLDQDPSVGPDA